jgi:uncharacterized protein YjbJ (UPF0337 family)
MCFFHMQVKDKTMNKDEFQGGARYIGGKVEKTIGDTVSSRDWQVDGVVDQVAGGAQNLYGRAKSAVADAVDGAPELADKLGSDAREAADRAGQLARQGARTVQESAEDAPLLWALGAAAIGYGLAWLVHGQRD